MEESDPTYSGSNQGLQRRWEFTNSGDEVEMESILMTDLAFQEKLIPNGIRLGLKLYPQSKDVVLMAADEPLAYDYRITDIILRVCKVTVSDEIIQSQNEVMLENDVIIPYQKSVMRSYQIPVNSFSYNVRDMHTGAIPLRMYIAMVRSESISGGCKLNQYNYKSFDVNYIQLLVNGIPMPGAAFQPDFANKKYLREYNTLFSEVTGGNNISREDYGGGYFIIKFDIDPWSSDNYASPAAAGQASLSLRFKPQLPYPVTLLCYSVFEAELRIDGGRNIELVDL